MSNEGRDTNANWDGIWDVGTRIGEDGWYAEIEIPFRTLKFGADDAADLGHQLPAPAAPPQREQLLVAAAAHSPAVARVDGRHARRAAGTAAGRQPARQAVRARQARTRSATGDLDGDFDAGFDVKYGVTSGLTWDFTVNTDFSQVEADEQQVNLTRFSLFFPEKRDFFLENSGVFQFGVGGNTGGGGGGGGGRQNASQDMILFFSRQIGLSTTGDAIPILAGTRLTGRVGGFSVGALNIQQRETERSPAPSTNFTALRAAPRHPRATPTSA